VLHKFSIETVDLDGSSPTWSASISLPCGSYQDIARVEESETASKPSRLRSGNAEALARLKQK
jgi:hypothetical protein